MVNYHKIPLNPDVISVAVRPPASPGRGRQSSRSSGSARSCWAASPRLGGSRGATGGETRGKPGENPGKTIGKP